MEEFDIKQECLQTPILIRGSADEFFKSTTWADVDANDEEINPTDKDLDTWSRMAESCEKKVLRYVYLLRRSRVCREYQDTYGLQKLSLPIRKFLRFADKEEAKHVRKSTDNYQAEPLSILANKVCHLEIKDSQNECVVSEEIQSIYGY